MNYAEIERRIYKDYRNTLKRTQSGETMYGGNWERIQNDYYMIYLDYFNNLLLNLITYKNGDDEVPITLDVRFLEYCLRMFGFARIGGNSENVFVVGPNDNAAEPYAGAYGWLMDKTEVNVKALNTTLKQINRLNYQDLSEGYVTLSNKYSWYLAGVGSQFTDFQLIERVAKTLALIKATQVRNIEQFKTPYVGYTSNKNLTAKNIWNNVNAGIPFIEVDDDIGDINRIFNIANLNVQDHLASLKDQFNNEMNEMYTILGINVSGVDKKERLLKNEINANSQVTEASGNIYLDARNAPLDLFNKVTGLKLQAIYNQDSVQELVKLQDNINASIDGRPDPVPESAYNDNVDK